MLSICLSFARRASWHLIAPRSEPQQRRLRLALPSRPVVLLACQLFLGRAGTGASGGGWRWLGYEAHEPLHRRE